MSNTRHELRSPKRSRAISAVQPACAAMIIFIAATTMMNGTNCGHNQVSNTRSPDYNAKKKSMMFLDPQAGAGTDGIARASGRRADATPNTVAATPVTWNVTTRAFVGTANVAPKLK